MRNEALLDTTALDVIREIESESEPTLLQDIVNEYLRNQEVLRLGLREAFLKENFKEVERLAHSLKSSSMLVGLLRVGGLCAEIEHGKHRAVSICDELDHELREGLRHLREHLQEDVCLRVA